MEKVWKKKEKRDFLCLRGVHGDIGSRTGSVVGSGGRLTGVYLFFLFRGGSFFLWLLDPVLSLLVFLF